MVRPSKTAAKREADEAQSLARNMVDVPPDVLEGFGLATELLDALAEARRHRGHKESRRLLQHVGALIRGLDVSAIRAQLQQWRDVTGREPARLEQVRRWRDALVDGDDRVVDAVLAAAPLLERARLEELVAAARSERDRKRPPRDFRALFALIRDAVLAEDAAAPPVDRAPR
jgi:ribosome-associated protein